MNPGELNRERKEEVHRGIGTDYTSVEPQQNASNNKDTWAIPAHKEASKNGTKRDKHERGDKGRKVDKSRQRKTKGDKGPGRRTQPAMLEDKLRETKAQGGGQDQQHKADTHL